MAARTPPTAAPTPAPTVFWDFDGTLTVSNPHWSPVVHAALLAASPPRPPTYEWVRAQMRTGFPWHTPEADHTALVGDAFWEHLLAKFARMAIDCGLDPAAASRAVRPIRERMLDLAGYELRPDAAAVLAATRAAGFRNVLVTNNHPDLGRVLAGLGLAPLLDDAVISALVGYDKPRPEIFRIALERSGYPAAWMVGDNPTADIDGGRAAGLRTILVGDRTGGLPDFRVATLSEIPPILMASSTVPPTF